MRYIDADELIKFFNSYPIYVEFNVGDIKSIIKRIPTADVVPMDFHDHCMAIEIQKRMNMVEVVRCKDCKHYSEEGRVTRYAWCYKWKNAVNFGDFCSYGERAEA